MGADATTSTSSEAAEPASTIVMVPRETFDQWFESLEDVCVHRENDARILVVDAGSPPRVRRELERLAALHDVALLRVDHYLSHNQARNLAMQHVSTAHAVFIDNNVRVSPGWLSALERCAAETEAAVVAPILIKSEHGRDIVHHMGGSAYVSERDAKQTFHTTRWHGDEQLAGVGPLTRVVTEECEFHCALVNCAWFRRIGGLDEALLSILEHSDFSMRIRDAGGTIWFEPESIVSFGRPRFVDRRDRAYYVLRWSDEWNARSGQHFRSVWHLDVDPVDEMASWLLEYRRFGYRPFITPFSRMGRVGRPVVNLVDRLAQRRVRASWERERRSAPAPRFTHWAGWQATPAQERPSTSSPRRVEP